MDEDAIDREEQLGRFPEQYEFLLQLRKPRESAEKSVTKMGMAGVKKTVQRQEFDIVQRSGTVNDSWNAVVPQIFQYYSRHFRGE